MIHLIMIIVNVFFRFVSFLTTGKLNVNVINKKENQYLFTVIWIFVYALLKCCMEIKVKDH